MKITKWAWFFHTLGLLALVLAFGVMLVGCQAITIGGLVVGGIIGNKLDHVFIGIIIGGIIGLIVSIVLGIILGDSGVSSNSSSSSSYSSSSYYGSSSGPSIKNLLESRKNDPHTCGNCTQYSSGRGECRRSGNPMSAEDSCSDWD